METLNKNLLIALLDLAQSDTPASVQALSQYLQLSRRQVADELDLLAKEGLVRAETCRLTFVGLMHATGLRSAARRSAERQRTGCEAA